MREQRLSYGSPAGDVSRGRFLPAFASCPQAMTPELGLGFRFPGDVSRRPDTSGWCCVVDVTQIPTRLPCIRRRREVARKPSYFNRFRYGCWP